MLSLNLGKNISRRLRKPHYDSQINIAWVKIIIVSIKNLYFHS